MSAPRSSAWAARRNPFRVGAFDDLERQAGRSLDRGSGRGTLIAAVGNGALQEREEAAHLSEERRDLIAILHARRRDGDAEHQAERVDGRVPLLAFDFLCRVVANRIDARPPFSAPFTLWLSTIVVVGLASLPASSRACT